MQRFYSGAKAWGSTALVGGKGEHVGGFGFVAEGAVEARHVAIADEADEHGIASKSELAAEPAKEILKNREPQGDVALTVFDGGMVGLGLVNAMCVTFYRHFGCA